MARTKLSTLAQIVAESEAAVLIEWMVLLREAGSLQTGRLKEAELQTQARAFLDSLRKGLVADGESGTPSAYESAKSLLSDLSRSRAIQGFSPTQRPSCSRSSNPCSMR
jgi:rsbT co-antagonist protein RsbR